jgi:hypothetical protein
MGGYCNRIEEGVEVKKRDGQPGNAGSARNSIRLKYPRKERGDAKEYPYSKSGEKLVLDSLIWKRYEMVSGI